MGFVQKKMNKVVDFGFSLIPLLICVFTYKITKSWNIAFYFAAPFAITSLFKAIISKSRDIFLHSLNIFLVIGAFMFFFDIAWLQKLYKEFLFAMIFVWVFIVSFVLTFFTKEKLFDETVQDKKKVFNFSLYFITAAIAALGVSFYFRADYFLGAWLPFVILLIFKDFLSTFIKGATFEKFYLLGGEVVLVIIAAILKKYIFLSLLILIIGRKLLHYAFEYKYANK
jgi:hypothetical protein